MFVVVLLILVLGYYFAPALRFKVEEATEGEPWSGKQWSGAVLAVLIGAAAAVGTSAWAWETGRSISGFAELVMFAGVALATLSAGSFLTGVVHFMPPRRGPVSPRSLAFRDPQRTPQVATIRLVLALAMAGWAVASVFSG